MTTLERLPCIGGAHAAEVVEIGEDVATVTFADGAVYRRSQFGGRSPYSTIVVRCLVPDEIRHPGIAEFLRDLATAAGLADVAHYVLRRDHGGGRMSARRRLLFVGGPLDGRIEDLSPEVDGIHALGEGSSVIEYRRREVLLEYEDDAGNRQRMVSYVMAPADEPLPVVVRTLLRRVTFTTALPPLPADE